MKFIVLLFLSALFSTMSGHASLGFARPGTYRGYGFSQQGNYLWSATYSLRISRSRNRITLLLTNLTDSSQNQYKKIFTIRGVVLTGYQMALPDGTLSKWFYYYAPDFYRVRKNTIIERSGFRAHNSYVFAPNKVFVELRFSPGLFLFDGRRAEQGAAANP